MLCSEYTTWKDHDRHGQAYVVLLTDRSRIIEKNYRGLAKLEDARPEQDAACLACHSTAATTDGVGCERATAPRRSGSASITRLASANAQPEREAGPWFP